MILKITLALFSFAFLSAFLSAISTHFVLYRKKQKLSDAELLRLTKEDLTKWSLKDLRWLYDYTAQKTEEGFSKEETLPWCRLHRLVWRLLHDSLFL